MKVEVITEERIESSFSKLVISGVVTSTKLSKIGPNK